MFFQIYKWPSIKDDRTQWGMSSADIFRTRGVLQMRTSALFDAKNFVFSKFMVCQRGQMGRGVEPVLTFFGQGGKGVNFSRLCADVLYGRVRSLNKLHNIIT